MNAEQWDGLVRRLECEASENPRAYRRRVAMLGGLGYAVVLATVAVLVAAVAATIALFASGSGTLAVGQLGIALVVLVVILARALWIPDPAPEGIKVDRDQAPRLFEVVEEVRQRLNAPTIDHVLIDGSLNAALAQRARLGPLGWYRHHLILGLPLLSAVSIEEAKATIAHELGHSAGSHGRTADWAYRVSTTWMRLLEKLERRGHWATGPYKRFLRWHAPLFQAYSFPLARVQEYEADQAAVTVVGARCAGGDLVRTAIAAARSREVLWPAVFKQVETQAEPPRDALSTVVSQLRSAPADSRSSRWLEERLHAPTNTADTHPALSDRLAALGFEPGQISTELAAASSGVAPGNAATPAENPPARPSAAEELLGELEVSLLERLDSEWRSAIAEEWAERHRGATAAKRRLMELENGSPGSALSTDEVHERASLTWAFRGWDDAAPLLREVLARDESHADAHSTLGEGLLESGDDTGLVHLCRAMELDEEEIPGACELAVDFLERHGRTEEAAGYRRRGDARLDLLYDAKEERSGVGRFDRFNDHGIADQQLEELRSQLRAHEDVRRAYLARKRVKHLAGEAPLYVLAVFPPFRVSSDERAASLAARVAETVELPGDGFTVVSEGPGKPVARRVRRGGSEVFRR